MFRILMLGSGLFWTLTYLLIIRRGVLDKTYGMPLVALCANLSWEFIFSFVHPHPSIQRPVDIVWLALDVVILLQLLRYGPREFADLSRGIFYSAFGLALVTSFCSVLFISYEFNDLDGTYAAFGQNLLMSVLFIAMLYRRRSLRGQSTWIAVCKLVGTALASLAFYRYTAVAERSILLSFLFGAILVYDSIYLGLVLLLRRAAAATREPAAVQEHGGARAVIP
ncbi:MAG: hypothetical protein M5U01_10870 [Ardenticatenaceae bacterium]|nr:hypothetical protein [Ardenticatenaceae bacterium]